MKLALRILLVGFLVLFPSVAHASGSDGPTPYTVTASGLQLPAGHTFPDNGHVNIRYTVDGVEHTAGIHFESLNNQPSGAWIGEDFLPWSALISAPSYCITWVQVADFNEHFGEGGQAPVCTTGTTEPGTDEPGTDEPGTDEPGTDEPGTDEPGTDEPGTDEPGTDEPGTDEPGTDEPGTDVPDTGVVDSGDLESDDETDQAREKGSSDDDAVLPNTGGPGLWIALAGAAMIAAGAVVLRRRSAA